MDAQDFLTAASQPEGWYEKSSQLRRAGNVVWNAYAQESNILKQMGYLTTASMLYAMALEVAMKGRLLESKDIRVAVETGETGEIRRASVQKAGGLNHDLVALANSLGLIGTDAGRRKLLERLTDCLVWIARYPAPRSVTAEKPMSPNVSIIIQNVSVRDLIDEMMDELLKSSDGVGS